MARGKAVKPAEPDEGMSQEEIDAAAAGGAEAQPEALPEPDAAPDEAVKPAEPKSKKAKARMETFDATRPDGTVVTVTRNIDTGEQTVADKK